MATFIALGSFLLLTSAVSYILSAMAWQPLSNRLPEHEFTGEVLYKVKPIFLEINEVSYTRCITIIVGRTGFVMKPSFFLKPFHNDLFVPWHLLKEQKQIGTSAVKILVVKELEIKISMSDFKKLKSGAPPQE